MAIDFEELEGSPKIEVGSEATRAQRKFRIAWSDWPEFSRLVVGGWKKTGKTFRRLEPLAFPGFPDVTVSEITIEPFDQFAPSGEQIESLRRGTNSYPTGGARVVVKYRSLKHPSTGLEPPIAAGTYLTYETTESEDILPTPSSAWVWDDDDTAVPDDVKTDLLMPRTIHKVGWHFVPLPPWSAIGTLRGRVNDAPFLGAATGTVMFLGARARQTFSLLAQPPIFSLEYRFAERTQTWNTFVKPAAGPIEIAFGVGGPPPYGDGNFNSLFSLSQLV